MDRREFMMLAKTYRPAKDNIQGWFMSEKLDGTRCFWDGGASRGKKTLEVPWANIFDPKKPDELKKKIKPVATGLWSRYGNPIIAPDWFLNQLPNVPLDGELCCGRDEFQLLRSIVAAEKPDERWHKVSYAVFSSPPFEEVFKSGLVKCTQMVREIKLESVQRFYAKSDVQVINPGATFIEELDFLQAAVNGDMVYVHQQVLLGDDPKAQIDSMLSAVVEDGGEGVMFRKPRSVWTPKRSSTLLKHKPVEDDEATIVGFVAGRRTDKGSKLLGKIGAVITCYKGRKLELAGFTDEERLFATDEQTRYAMENPGEIMPPDFQGRYFKVGDEITFKYSGVSDDGIPKIARYWRRPDRN